LSHMGAVFFWPILKTVIVPPQQFNEWRNKLLPTISGKT
jgi:hypothetical protein